MSQNLLRFAEISVYSNTFNNARCSKSRYGKFCLRVLSTLVMISYKLIIPVEHHVLWLYYYTYLLRIM